MERPAIILAADGRPVPSSLSGLLLRPLTERDLRALYGLSVEVAWPHRLEDWRFVLSVGHGAGAIDGAGRLIGSALWWPHGEGFGTIGMIIVSHRLQGRGLGRRMMRELFRQVGSRALRLNATPAGLRLAMQEGFREVGRIHQHQGIVRDVTPPASEGPAIRLATKADWDELLKLDAEASGADRGAMIESLLPQSVIWLGHRDGRLVGASYCRRFGRGHVVGPVLAPDDATAIALLQPHLATHAGAFLRTDTPAPEGAYTRCLLEAGLARVETVTTMARGEPPVGDQGASRLYGIVNQAIG